MQVYISNNVLNVQVNVEYRSWSCQDSQKLQNNASSHYPTTTFALWIYFSQNETSLSRIHLFRTKDAYQVCRGFKI